jgi:hypothetical protein
MMSQKSPKVATATEKSCTSEQATGERDIKSVAQEQHTAEDVVDANAATRSYNLLAYGVERARIKPPKSSIKSRNYSLTFEPFNTTHRFDEYDGMLLFQGIYEDFAEKSSYRGRHIVHSYDHDELDKREKELDLLLKKGGFVCFVLHLPFIDSNELQDISDTDLSKIYLNYPSFYRENLSDRVTHVRPCRGELMRFCELYGATWTIFKNFNEKLDLRPLVKVGDKLVGMVLWGNQFFLPSLLPEEHRVQEYFQTLADALVAIRNKVLTDIPPWVDAFTFPCEEAASSRVEELAKEVDALESQIETFRRFKHILVADGDALVEAVTLTLREGFGFSVDSTDEFREDIKILGADSKPVIFAEIKGTNSGVKREFINQADSHRERAGLSDTFPTLLIVNTHIKNARSIAEKDQDVPDEQIAHAKRNGVLILRTFDLLTLLRLKQVGRIESSAALELFQKNSGWLRCREQTIEVISS